MNIQLVARGFTARTTTLTLPEGEVDAVEVRVMDAESPTTITFVMAVEVREQFIAMIQDPEGFVAEMQARAEARSKIATVQRIDPDALKRAGLA